MWKKMKLKGLVWNFKGASTRFNEEKEKENGGRTTSHTSPERRCGHPLAVKCQVHSMHQYFFNNI